jgi:hypothetical protein
VLDAWLGLTSAPIDAPLWFIRDLAVILVISRVLALGLRRAPLLVAGLLFAGFFDPFRFWLSTVYLPPTALSAFSFGVFLAVQGRLPRLGAISRASLILGYGAGTLLLAFKADAPSLGRIALCLIPMGIWSAWELAGIVEARLPRLAGWVGGLHYATFLLFAAHPFPLLLLRKMFGASVAPMGPWISFAVFALAIPTIVVASCCISRRWLSAAPVGLVRLLDAGSGEPRAIRDTGRAGADSAGATSLGERIARRHRISPDATTRLFRKKTRRFHERLLEGFFGWLFPDRRNRVESVLADLLKCGSLDELARDLRFYKERCFDGDGGLGALIHPFSGRRVLGAAESYFKEDPQSGDSGAGGTRRD